MYGSKKHRTDNKRSPREEAEFQLGVVCSGIADHLTAVAGQEGYPFTRAEITDRVVRFLQDQALRDGMGGHELVPTLSQDGEGAGSGSRVGHQLPEQRQPKAVHVRPHGRRTLSKAARASIAAAQRKRWKLQKRAERAERAKPEMLRCKSCKFVAHSRGEMTAHYNSTHRVYKKAKRVLTPNQLRAMRKNAVLARAAHLAKLQRKEAA